MSATESLRERLHRQFGVDLPIRGGTGLAAAPIVVTSDALQDAVDVQVQVLNCLARGGGAAWRLVGHEIVGPRLVRADIDTLVVNAGQAVGRREAIHFALEALPVDAATTSLPPPSGFVDPRSGLRLPCQLGWLHLVAATDQEPDEPGRGWSVAYDSPVVQGSVYVYDRGEHLDSDDLESARVIDEFRSAVSDALADHPDAGIQHQALFKDESGRGRCLLAILDLPGNSMSGVLLTVWNGHFVRAHVSFDASVREFGRMARESMEAFVDAVRPAPSS